MTPPDISINPKMLVLSACEIVNAIDWWFRVMGRILEFKWGLFVNYVMLNREGVKNLLKICETSKMD
jgi:hypothetical protein